ncbi:PREDICTED: CTL-like protein 1 [Nicrophorus vespilloides]|uniref:Choline transporter-like protein n=1 Tax=Nicrophorus vespilloides TaxID=110193 RepID=A0ABM1MRY6_NICVS|nr:PREDICTED: CTL-like protein 1 [Nicrophorus vespilloides]
MGCCLSSDDDEETNKPEDAITGPRTCTDILWLTLYILFWCLMVFVAAFSFVYGNPIRIINGYDSFGNTCGTSNNKGMGNMDYTGLDTSSKPYLLFYDIRKLSKSLKICVNECPTETMNKVDDINAYYKKTGNKICNYDFNYNDFSNRSIDKNILSGSYGPCPVLPVYASTPVLNRCVPKPVKELTNGVLGDFYSFLNNWDTLEQILGDLYNTWREMFGLAFLALLLSLAVICILHLLAYLVSYIIMILVSIASVGGTAFLWYTYHDIKHNLDKTNKSMLLLESVRNETAFLWYSIIATIITIIILLLVIVMRKKVDFLSDLFKETSKCILHIPALFFQPLFTFLVLLGFFSFWVFVILCLATAYYPGKTGISTVIPSEGSTSEFTTTATKVGLVEKLENLNLSDIKKLTIVEFIDPTWVKYMWWVYFIGLIWTSEFIMGCQSMVIAGSVAHWYYRHKYKDNDHVSYAICKLIKYHLGSVAKGSFLITIFKVPRLIMMYIHSKLSRNKDKGSECATCTLKCCICCFYCLEKFIKYINHNAYTVIAIDGVHFCKAAKTAFEVLVSHSLEVATINSIGDFILFLGKCLVTAVTGSVGLYFFRLNPKLNFYAAPTLLVCIFSFFIAHCILSLYEMVLDTIYLCMCQNNDATEGIQLQNFSALGAAKNGNASPQQQAEQELVVEDE